MKKIIILGLLLMATTAFAAEEPIVGCMTQGALNYNPEATVAAPCEFLANSNPLQATMPWGLTGFETQKAVKWLAPGEGSCPKWYPKSGCWDITMIPNYAQKMVDWYYSWNKR